MSFNPLIPMVRDSVVTTLNSAAFATPAGSPIIAIAIYDIVFNLAQLSAGRIVVKPTHKADKLFTRGGPEDSDITIDVAVQYKYNSSAASELDPYMTMAEQIAAHKAKGGLFLGDPVGLIGASGPTRAVCIRSEFMPGLFAVQEIKEFRIFHTSISLTFTLKQ